MESLIRPQLVYTPDGSLVFRSALSDRYRYPDRDEEDYLPQTIKAREEALEKATVLPGVKVESNEGLATIATDIEEFMYGVDSSSYERVRELLQIFNRLSTYKINDEIDRVVAFDSISDRGSQATINHHFQRWLNSPECMTEEIGRRTHEALLLPFDDDFIKRERKDFRFDVHDGYYYAGSTIMIGVGLKKDTLNVTRLDREAKGYERGKIDWFFPNISTLGNCACWGVDGMDIDDLTLHNGISSKGLYEMHPHNVDLALQALAHLLALGVLSHEASKYEGNEDVFKGVEWIRTI